MLLLRLVVPAGSVDPAGSTTALLAAAGNLIDVRKTWRQRPLEKTSSQPVTIFREYQ
jgi:hypothetical protein